MPLSSFPRRREPRGHRHCIRIRVWVGALPLDAEDKAFVFDALGKPPSLAEIAGLAQGQEQAAELWLASRIAIDPDHPMEQAYLEGLASRLNLPKELVGQLEAQVAAVTTEEDAAASVQPRG